MLFIALLSTLQLAAPVPFIPTIEGKYTLLAQPSGRDRGSGPVGGGIPGTPRTITTVKRDVAIARDTIVIDGQTTTWEYRLDSSVKPLGIDIAFAPIRGKKSKALGIVEVAGDRMTIAYSTDGAARPKDTEDAEGVAIFVFQKAPPPARVEYRIVVLTLGGEEAVEKKLNTLAKEGFEVSTVTPSAVSALVNMTPSIHYLLKRTVPGTTEAK